MIDPKTRQEIRYRHDLGESERSIAAALKISRNTVHAYLIDQNRGMSLSSPSKRRSLLHSADQEKLKRLFTAASGNCVVVTRLLNDDPSCYGLPETCSFSERSVRRLK